MRHKTIPMTTEMRQQIIRKLLHEAAGRAEVVADIHKTLQSILTQSDETLATVRVMYVDLGNYPDLRDQYRVKVKQFYQSASGIINSLRDSVRMLGTGDDERLLISQIDRTADLVDRVYSLSTSLLQSSEHLLTENKDGYIYEIENSFR